MEILKLLILYKTKTLNGVKSYLQVDGHILRSNVEELSLNSFQKSTDTGSLLAPVPGKLIKLLCGEGVEVKKGQTLMILESMKMEFGSEVDKRWDDKKILVEEGTQVDADTLQLHLKID